MTRVTSLLALMALTCTIDSQAQAHFYNRSFDPNTVESLSGMVAGTDSYTPPGGSFEGVVLLVETENELIPVHLGPRWYLDDQPVQIERGDFIEVIGSRVLVDERPAVIAARVDLEGATIILKRRDGRPAWHGRTPRNP